MHACVSVREKNNGLLGNVTIRRSYPRRDASRDFMRMKERRQGSGGREAEIEIDIDTDRKTEKERYKEKEREGKGDA